MAATSTEPSAPSESAIALIFARSLSSLAPSAKAAIRHSVSTARCCTASMGGVLTGSGIASLARRGRARAFETNRVRRRSATAGTTTAQALVDGSLRIQVARTVGAPQTQIAELEALLATA